VEGLRYSANEQSALCIAVRRTFTGGLSGQLSDQFAAEVSAALAVEGIEAGRLQGRWLKRWYAARDRCVDPSAVTDARVAPVTICPAWLLAWNGYWCLSVDRTA